MSKFIVVSIHRDRYFWPKLTVKVEARCSTETAANTFITLWVMDAYRNNLRGRSRKYINVKDFRIVDEVGLRRLLAAAKASATIRRKRAAKKAAATRAKNRLANKRARLDAYDRISRGSPALLN